MRSSPLRTALLALAVGFFLGAPSALGGEPSADVVRTAGDIDLHPNGDGRAVIEIRMARAQYTLVKRNFPNPQQFLRDFTSRRANWEVGPEARAAYDDSRSAVRLELTEVGGLRNAGAGHWSLEIAENLDFITFVPGPDGRTLAHFYEVGQWPGGITYRGPVHYRLPEGATEPRWDEATRTLAYVLARPAGGGPAKVDWTLQVQPRLMTAIYKVYGLGADFAAMWVAKCVFRNVGASDVRDLRVRYRLEGYSEWSPWQRFPELVPDQSAVSNYYPVLHSHIAKLTSNTPANLLMEWRYQDLGGRQHEDSTGARLVLLGGHEFVFSNLMQGESYGTWHEGTNNAPFVAAWVSRDDMVVKQFAALANKNAGGLGAGSSDENAVKVLRAIYELWQANDFTYQHPPGVLDKSLSFDVQMVQNIKYPRDVIRDKSGTCIDLAICYAALANSVGLRPYLAFIPGHCFPVFELPSGNVVAVEATGVAGGRRHGSAPFPKMLEAGIKELVEARRDGRVHMIDLYALWTNGVSNPELPALPPDVLARWGIRRDAPDASGGPPAAPDAFSGTWAGTVNERLEDGRTLSYPFVLNIARQPDGSYQLRAEARAQVPSPQGAVVVVLQEEYTGSLEGGRLRFRGTRKVLTANGRPVESPLDRGRAELEGGQLVGQRGNDKEGFTPFRLSRR